MKPNKHDISTLSNKTRLLSNNYQMPHGLKHITIELQYSTTALIIPLFEMNSI